MLDEKQLNLDELEAVSGGVFTETDAMEYVSGSHPASDAYNFKDKNVFIQSGCTRAALYVTINDVWEKYGMFELWSFTHFSCTVLYSSNGYYKMGETLEHDGLFYENCSCFEY